jgi:hypothetical protein
MHNCKSTRTLAVDFLLDQTVPSNELVAEFRRCSACREEYDALKHALRVTTRVVDSTAPPEEYWPGYQVRLKEKLDNARVPALSTRAHFRISSIFGISIRIPLPVAAALIVLFGVLLFFASHTSTSSKPAEVSVVKIPVEVPIIKEKLVTRVVYRDRYRVPSARKSDQANGATGQPTLARSQKNDAPASLLGFKPLEEIKLTVIKGGGNDK